MSVLYWSEKSPHNLLCSSDSRCVLVKCQLSAASSEQCVSLLACDPPPVQAGQCDFEPVLS